MKVRVSRRGVPHLIFSIDGKQYSACYFARGGFYRLWNWDRENKKIGDITINKGEEFDLEDKIKQLICLTKKI